MTVDIRRNIENLARGAAPFAASVALILLLTANGPAWAQSGARNFVVSYDRLGLTFERVIAATSVAVPDGVFRSGVIRSDASATTGFRAGYYQLQPILPGGLALSRAIKLTYDQEAEGLPFRAFACRMNDCEELGAGKSEVRFSLDASAFAANLFGNPCEDSAKKCEITVASWAVDQMRLRAESSVRGSGDILTVLETVDGTIHLVRPLFQDVWLSISRRSSQEFSEVGPLVSASMAANGVLSLVFTTGYLQINFARDTWILGKGRYVLLGSGGIATLTSTAGADIVWDFGSVPETALAYSGASIVYQSGILAVDWSAAAFRAGKFAAFNPFEGVKLSRASLFVDSGGAEHVLGIDFAGARVNQIDGSGKVTLVATLPASIGAERVELIGSKPFIFHKDGMKILQSSTVGDTSLARPIRSGLNVGEGHLFLKEYSSSGACVMNHFRQNAKDPASFSESGFVDRCDGAVTYAGNQIDGGALLTTRRDSDAMTVSMLGSQ